MHIFAEYTADKAKEIGAAKPPFGCNFEKAILEQLHTLRILGSNVNDIDEHCVFEAFDAAGKKLGSKRMPGY